MTQYKTAQTRKRRFAEIIAKDIPNGTPFTSIDIEKKWNKRYGLKHALTPREFDLTLHALSEQSVYTAVPLKREMKNRHCRIVYFKDSQTADDLFIKIERDEKRV